MSGGTVRISRALWADTAFSDEPFSEREAWVWMICEASWKPRERRIGRVVVGLERGQLAGSVRFFADAWGWSKSRVHRFFDRLVKRDMIGTDAGTGVMVITLCKYDEYQAPVTGDGTEAGHTSGQKRDSSGTNEKKGERKRKEYIGDFDAFWSEVPRKIGKGAARKAYASALRKTDAETLLEAMRRFAASQAGKDAQFIPHPSTWLNAERWTDEDRPALRVVNGSEVANAAEFWAGKINSGAHVPTTAISGSVLSEIQARGLVPPETLKAKGLV